MTMPLSWELTTGLTQNPRWLSGFLRRHSELSIRKPEATSISRAVGFNQGQVGIFFKVYK